MVTGVLYVMSSAVKGLIKIGKTETRNFPERMRKLETDGYRNVTSFKRRFAIEVEDYDEKERMLDEIFSKARVSESELFALDIDLAVKLLSSFEGRQIYPEAEPKEQVFAEATKQHREHTDVLKIPNGTYYLVRKKPPLHVQMIVEDGELTIPAGQRVSTTEGASIDPHTRIGAQRRECVDQAGVVIKDMHFDTPSAAGVFAIGRACNGWKEWKTEDGRVIGSFR